MAVSDLSSHLELDEHGIWRARETEALSYPKEGNAACFQLEDGSFWFRHRNACIVALVQRFRPTGALIDVGGGNGFVTKGLIDAGLETILLEPGPAGALNAKSHRNVPEVICSTIENARFKAGSVSAVGLFDVLEHLDDDHGAVSDLARALVPGGLFFGTVPAHEWLWSTADETAHHLRRYDQRSLDELFRSDYEVLYSTYFFQALTLPIFMARALPYRLGLTKKKVLVDADEHGMDEGVATRTINWLLRRELARIESGGRQRWGASLLFVARR